jgi:hypothetical protein
MEYTARREATPDVLTADMAYHLEILTSSEFSSYVEKSFTSRECNLVGVVPRANSNSAGSETLVRVERLPTNDRQLAITVLHRNPEAAALLANRWGRKYDEYLCDLAVFGKNKTPVPNYGTGLQDGGIRLVNRAEVPSKPEHSWF